MSSVIRPLTSGSVGWVGRGGSVGWVKLFIFYIVKQVVIEFTYNKNFVFCLIQVPEYKCSVQLGGVRCFRLKARHRAFFTPHSQLPTPDS